MPQRFLRPGLRNSHRWNSVNLLAQKLYIGILTLVDDFGRYDGRASVLCGECFAVWNSLRQESAADCCDTPRTAALRSELLRDNLLEYYESEGKEVIQVTQWQERPRGTKSKWPNPQESAAERRGKTPPSSSSSSTPSSSPTPSDARAIVGEPQQVAADRSGLPANVCEMPASPEQFHVELPDRFPGSLVEAVAQTMTIGCPVDFVKKTWDLAMSRGGLDSKQVPIRRWANHVSVCWGYEKERLEKDKQAPAASNGTVKEASVWEMTKAVELKQERLKEMRFQHGHHDPDGRFIWKDATKRDEGLAVIAEIKELKLKIEANVK